MKYRFKYIPLIRNIPTKKIISKSFTSNFRTYTTIISLIDVKHSNLNYGLLLKCHLSTKFSDDELKQLSENIDPLKDITLNYYTLKSIGERFPINDPNKKPVLEPKPESRKEYLHGILQGITKVEKDGYAALAELGASSLIEVYTAGGGAKNNMWMKMRERYLGVPTKTSSNIDAAYGAALLAIRIH